MNTVFMKTGLAAAAMMLISTAASAVTLQLTGVFTKPGSNPGAPLTISGDSHFDYTPGHSLVSQGEWIGTASFNALIYRLNVDGMEIDLSNSLDVDATTANSFTCTEGTFLGIFGANGCGNYGWGDDFVSQTSLDYSTINPTRTTLPGSDDVYYGDMQSLWNYTNMQVFNLDPVFEAGKTAFILSNRTGGADSGDGFSMTFAYAAAVPVPAAAWLFGSAIGLLGWLRRR